MRLRGFTVLAITIASLSAQIARTPEGRPDLSGIYDIATLTPLVRPANLADRQSLSDAEAKAVAEHQATALQFRLRRFVLIHVPMLDVQAPNQSTRKSR